MTSLTQETSVTNASVSAREEDRDRAIWIATTAIVAVLFLLLENPYWVPGGDSEVYVASARNIVLGNGYMFNGQAAKIAPPGWPLLLAFVMKFISPSFLLLKLLTLSCMAGALAVYYRVLRRFASPELSASLILLSAITSHVYALTFWLHSDALFALITAIMLLLSLQISEGKTDAPRIIALMLLCAAGAFVRYAGIINIVIIVAALLQGELIPKPSRKWVLAMLVVVMTMGSFFAIRWAVNHFAPPRVPFEASAHMDPSAVLTDADIIATDAASQSPSLVTGTNGRTGYFTRILGYGTWFSYLLWQPFRLATGIHAIWWIATAIGWIVAILASFAAIDALRNRQWLLPAVGVYTIGLCLNWPHATARYLVPIAPLIYLMIARGCTLLQTQSIGWLLRSPVKTARLATQVVQGFPIDSAPRAKPPFVERAVQLSSALQPSRGQRTVVRWLTIVGFASVILCNLAIYEEELRVMRSSHFADRYEAGLNKGLIAAGEYLNEMHVGNWQACVSPEYINIGKRRMSPTGTRILTMLTGKATQQLPEKWTRAKTPNDRDFRRQFIAKGHVAYYLEQATISPWRVWHYRMGWLQKWLTGEPVIDTGAGWKLYRCNGAEKPIEIPLPDVKEYPRRVPGL